MWSSFYNTQVHRFDFLLQHQEKNYLCFSRQRLIPELEIFKEERHGVHTETINTPGNVSITTLTMRKYENGEKGRFCITERACPSKTAKYFSSLEQWEGSSSSDLAALWGLGWYEAIVKMTIKFKKTLDTPCKRESKILNHVTYLVQGYSRY